MRSEEKRSEDEMRDGQDKTRQCIYYWFCVTKGMETRMKKRNVLRTTNIISTQTNALSFFLLHRSLFCWIFPHHEHVFKKGMEQQGKIAIVKRKFLCDNKHLHMNKKRILEVPSLSSPDHFPISPRCLMNCSSLLHVSYHLFRPTLPSVFFFFSPLLKENITYSSSYRVGSFHLLPKNLSPPTSPHTPPQAGPKSFIPQDPSRAKFSTRSANPLSNFPGITN
jgi:hypothetical protein